VTRGLERTRRQKAILDIVSRSAIPSQGELATALRKRGFRVTQATLSRDLKELRLSRVPTADGYRYAPAETEPASPAADRLAAVEVMGVEANESVVVLRTLAGHAQSVGVFLDGLKHAEILGTIAGDDTVLVLPRSTRRTARLKSALGKLFGFEKA